MSKREVMLFAVDLFLEQCPRDSQNDQIHCDYMTLAVAASKRYHGIKSSNRQMIMELQAFSRLRAAGLAWRAIA